jgi:EpsI family protein
LLIGGREALKLTWFPITYLLVGVPIWDQVIGKLQAPSQLLSARISVIFLRLCSIPATREGTLVGLPNVTLDVLPECSGVNQLIAVVAMTLPAAYLWLRGYWRRVAFVSVAIVIAYISNGFRIALVGFLSYHGWGNGNLRTLHLGEGLVVSLIGYLFIAACLSLLGGWKGSPSGEASWGGPVLATPRGRSHRWIDISLLLLLLTAGTVRYTFRTDPVATDQRLLTFPTRIGDWKTVGTTESAPIRVTRADDELERTYENSAGDRIRLYVGYQTYQMQGKELPDLKNNPSLSRISQLDLAIRPRTGQVNQALLKTSGRTAETVFWYDLNGRVVASRYLAKGYVVFDTLVRGRSNGAVIMIDWERPAARDAVESRERALGFVQEVLAIMPEYLPS